MSRKSFTLLALSLAALVGRTASGSDWTLTPRGSVALDTSAVGAVHGLSGVTFVERAAVRVPLVSAVLVVAGGTGIALRAVTGI